MEVKCFVSNLLFENCYAVSLNNEIAIIDPGEFTIELKKYVILNGKNIKYILLTHRHFDHILGTFELLEYCPNAKVVIHSLDSASLYNSAVSLASDYMLIQNPITADILCDDGDKLPFANTYFTVLHTPGHSLGSVCYFLNNAIFCGDTIFYASIGRTDLPTGDNNEMINSLRKLKALETDYTLYSGHGKVTSLFFEKAHNRYLRNI